jgi:DNA-binding transcriptional ArsR family regulator
MRLQPVSSAPNRRDVQRVFEALSSTVRRKILAYLTHAELTAGEIAARFDISKSAVSQHLNILENAGLVASEKRGQFVHYRLVPDSLANTLNSYVQLVCPVSGPLKKESAVVAQAKVKRGKSEKADEA